MIYRILYLICLFFIINAHANTYFLGIDNTDDDRYVFYRKGCVLPKTFAHQQYQINYKLPIRVYIKNDLDDGKNSNYCTNQKAKENIEHSYKITCVSDNGGPETNKVYRFKDPKDPSKGYQKGVNLSTIKYTIDEYNYGVGKFYVYKCYLVDATNNATNFYYQLLSKINKDGTMSLHNFGSLDAGTQNPKPLDVFDCTNEQGVYQQIPNDFINYKYMKRDG